jgi:hypothetical protein
MGKIKNALIRFMYGRNGADKLGQVMLWVYLGIMVLQLIFGSLEWTALAVVCQLLMYVLMFVILFRMFSRNLGKRRAENQRFVNWWWRVKNSRGAAKARRADTDHKYFTCGKCKTVCRVPAGKGKVIITCPKCGTQIQAKT